MAGHAPGLVMISLDGLRPDFYLDPTYETPTLRTLCGQGCHAKGVQPVYPSLTYPNHTTLVTGALPAEHGIVSNCRFSKQSGPLREWYWDERWIQVPTLWQRATALGKKVGLLRWPVTQGARSEWVVPEVFAFGDEKEKSNFELALSTSTPGFLEDVFRSVSAGWQKREMGRREHDDWVSVAAAFLLSQRRPDLLLVHLIDVDHVQHEHGRASLLLKESLWEADRAIKRIVSEIDLKKTSLMIVGDHGFVDFKTHFRVNQFLQEEGWGALESNWQVIAHVDGGGAAVYARNGIDIGRLGNSLKRYEGDAYRVIDRKELRILGAFPEAFCALDPMPGISLKDGSGPLWETMERTQGRHGDHPDTTAMDAGAIFCGPGVEANSHWERIQIRDLAALAARCMGLCTLLGFCV